MGHIVAFIFIALFAMVTIIAVASFFFDYKMAKIKSQENIAANQINQEDVVGYVLSELFKDGEISADAYSKYTIKSSPAAQHLNDKRSCEHYVKGVSLDKPGELNNYTC